MAMQLPDDFKEFLKLLNDHQVNYLLIGGYAVGIYGYPRATGDLDIWVSNDAENAKKLAAVVREFGFDSPEVKPELFYNSDRIFRMGMPPIRIELFASITGLDFDECFPLRVIKKVSNLEVVVIDLQNLIKNKKMVGRHKDLDDIEKLL